MLHHTAGKQPATDGWVGAWELPGYRAGNVVVRLADLPTVYPDHLYFHLLLLDAGGQLQDDHSGPCYALPRGQSLGERSRYVRVVAELVRHAPSEDRGLSAIGQALSYIRQLGVDIEHLPLAAQLLDDASTESAVVLALIRLLELSLGVDEAPLVMGDVVASLVHRPAFGLPAGDSLLAGHAQADTAARHINGGGLALQVPFVVRSVGKAHARQYLRDVIQFALLPTPDMFGL